MTSQGIHPAKKAKKPSNSWRVMTLGEVGEIVSGGTPSTAIPEYWGDEINWISPSDLTGYKEKSIKKGAKSITKLGLKNSSARVIPKGSVLFSSRAPIGYVAIAADDLSTNQGFKSIVPHEFVLSEYLYYFLSASKQQAEKVASGTTFKEISKSKFAELQIPIPDLATQQAIVSKIEELFSELDKGVESLRTAQQQLKVYRQSVLKWAFEGRLTNIDVKEGELPEGWRLIKFKEVFDIHVGSTPSRKISEYWNGQINWISSGEVKFKNIISTKEKITQLGLDNTSCKVHPKGTVILAMIGEGKTRGQTAILHTEASHNQNTAAIRVEKSKTDSRLLYYFLVYNYEQTRKGGSGNNQKALNKSIIEQFTFPLPPRPEQPAIVNAIESRISNADKIEESIIQSLQQAEVMRQSVLKRAFEGQIA